jgi:hypothetical protein
MQIVATWLVAGVLLCAGPAVAGAQDQPKAAPDQNSRQEQTQPQAPDHRGAAPPQSGTSAAPEGSLSHELNRSGGVIHPPPTGNSGVIPPPNQGTSRTPVIPPPGSPGGNPKVQPK